MHPKSQALLIELATLCRTVFLGQNEWQRLYEIALCLHTHGGMPEHGVIKRYLLEHGCSLQKAGFLSRQIVHLCTVLQMHDAQRQNSRAHG